MKYLTNMYLTTYHMVLLIIAIQILDFTNALESYSPEVVLPQGKLKGSLLESRNGRKYSSFLGIPYGKIHQRFEVAKPDDGWGDDIFDATKFGPLCYQFEFGGSNITGSEDCLSVNVYSPVTDKKLPVISFIHGGSFTVGGNQLYEAKYFMDEDIILVTINYRLGVFGFLSTDDKELSGNLGMKDQVLALKWIRDNIEKFNGDPENVTIFGESAGAASVGYHLISPLSSGLFHRAISFSGSAICPWSLQRKPLRNAKIIGDYLHCPVDNTKNFVSCLQTKSPEELLLAQQKLTQWFIFPAVPLGIVVENDGEDAFISQSPYELLSSGKTISTVPYMIGINQDEGLIADVPIIANENLTAELNSDWLRIAPIVFDYKDAAGEEHLDEISDRIKGFYFHDEEIGEESWSSLTELFSDRLFNHGVYRAALFHARKARVYPFMFSFPGEYSLITTFYGIKDQYGVSHSDSLQYLFNGVYSSPEYIDDSEIREFSENFVKLLASFAESGKPTATWGPEKNWKPVAPHKPLQWYQIDIKTNIWEDDLESRVAFWEGLPLQELKNEKRQFENDEL